MSYDPLKYCIVFLSALFSFKSSVGEKSAPLYIHLNIYKFDRGRADSLFVATPGNPGYFLVFSSCGLTKVSNACAQIKCVSVSVIVAHDYSYIYIEINSSTYNDNIFTYMWYLFLRMAALLFQQQ